MIIPSEATYYNDVYKIEGKRYSEDYKSSMYFKVWQKIVEMLKYREGVQKILEIGCGCGQLARYLQDEGYLNYLGFDFSTVAIDIARSNSKQQLMLGSAYNKEIYDCDYNVVIATEVLEHFKKDINVLNNIKTGTFVIATLPTFNCTGHFRWFAREDELRDRYSDVLNIKSIQQVDDWFLISGDKR